MNKYYNILDKIVSTSKEQKNKKGEIKYLINETIKLSPGDLLDIFEGHSIAVKN